MVISGRHAVEIWVCGSIGVLSWVIVREPVTIHPPEQRAIYIR